MKTLLELGGLGRVREERGAEVAPAGGKWRRRLRLSAEVLYCSAYTNMHSKLLLLHGLYPWLY